MNALNASVLRSSPTVDEAKADALHADALSSDPHKLVVLDGDAAFPAEAARCVRAEEEIIRAGICSAPP